VISSSQRPLPANTRHSQQTNIHAPGGIRTNDLSRRAAADLRLRQRGHWDRHWLLLVLYIIVWVVKLMWLLVFYLMVRIFRHGRGYQEVLLQVWFQNRRAKFRRNERSVLAQRSGLYGRETSHQLGGSTAAAEQPLAPRPTAVLPPGTVHRPWRKKAICCLMPLLGPALVHD